MNKLARLISNLPPKDLVLVQKDIEQGNLSRLVQKRLEEIQQGPQKNCPVCGTEVHAQQAIRIEYGSADLRRQAFFDATDCLEHFITNNLKNTKREP